MLPKWIYLCFYRCGINGVIGVTTTLLPLLTCIFISPCIGLCCREVCVLDAGSAPVLGSRISPGAAQALGKPWHCLPWHKFWKNEVSNLPEVKTLSKPGTGDQRGPSCLCAAFTSFCQKMQFGCCRVGHGGGCISQEGCTNGLQICAPSAPFAAF